MSISKVEEVAIWVSIPMTILIGFPLIYFNRPLVMVYMAVWFISTLTAIILGTRRINKNL